MPEHARTIPAPLGAAATGEYARLRRDALLRIRATWPGINLRTEWWRARKAEAKEHPPPSTGDPPSGTDALAA